MGPLLYKVEFDRLKLPHREPIVWLPESVRDGFEILFSCIHERLRDGFKILLFVSVKFAPKGVSGCKMITEGVTSVHSCDVFSSVFM